MKATTRGEATAGEATAGEATVGVGDDDVTKRVATAGV